MGTHGPIRGGGGGRFLSGLLAMCRDVFRSVSALAVSVLCSETHRVRFRHFFTHLATLSIATVSTGWASSAINSSGTFVHLAWSVCHCW